MPGIGDYIGLSKVVLAEGGKYFALLLVSVLAIRLWRNGLKIHGSVRVKNFLLARWPGEKISAASLKHQPPRG
ncbi:MAG TPA: hypothetical protein VIK53_18500 [Verrucomicrobiae bacterium]